MRTILIVSLVLLVVSCPCSLAVPVSDTLPHVVIVATGGTIAGTGSSSGELLNYTPGTISISDLMATVPGAQHVRLSRRGTVQQHRQRPDDPPLSG